MTKLSIRETYAGRKVLITGSSGFVGKVWLAMMLQRLPEIGHIYVVLRGKGRGVADRFERLVNTSPGFKALHEEFGPDLSRHISDRVSVIEGDISAPDMGIDPETAKRVKADVDLVINSAGLVEFNPDIREALSSNVEGAVYAMQFAKECDHAAFVHISTCYVAGMQDGRVPETVVAGTTPDGQPFDAEKEFVELKAIVDRVEAEQAKPESMDALREQVLERIRDRGYEPSEKRVGEMVKRLARKQLKEAMTQAGTDRSQELGWTNTYTYTKALGEALIAARSGDLAYSVFRPAIVESAMEYPFPGWNEGFNTCGPMVYLSGTWLRHIPAKPGNPFDVVPVDQLCRAITIVGAATMRKINDPVYHCGTSDRNLLTIDRGIDLSALGHRQHLRRKGETPLRRLVLSRWDVVSADPEHVLNVGNIRSVLRQSARFLKRGLPEKIPSEVREKADDLAKSTDSAERRLRQIDEVLDLFQPFTHDTFTIFECQAIAKFDVVEPEFRFEPEAIDWREYWLDAHLPGLRRWCFPEYEGRDRESYVAPDEFKLLQPAAAQRKEAG